MNKMKVLVGAMLASSLALVGCNSVSNIGSVGNTQFQAVRSNDLFGPSGLVVVSVDGDTGEQAIVGTFASDGAFPSAMGAAGNIVAAEVYDGDNHNTNTTVSGSVNVKQSNNNRRHPLQPARP